ncbi:hypothetical protein KI387_022258, partial [Taxus chinensis]
STKPSLDRALQVVKCLTMGDSAMTKDRNLDLLGELGLAPCFDEEYSEEMQLEH